MIKSAHLAINSLLVWFLLTGFAAAQVDQYTVQLEALLLLEKAQERVQQLNAQGLDAYIVKSQVTGKGTFFRVRVGKFPNQNEARKYGASLQTRGVVPEYFIAAYEVPEEDFTITRGGTLASSPPPSGPLTPSANPPLRAEPPPSTTPVTVENASKGTPAAIGNPSGPGNSFLPGGTGANLTSSSGAPIPSSVSFLRFQ